MKSSNQKKWDSKNMFHNDIIYKIVRIKYGYMRISG